MDPDICMDLEVQLENNLEHIISRYSSYVDCICTSIKDKGVTITEFRAYLLSLPAFGLSAELKVEIVEATNMNQIFLIVCNCASFLNYDIFEKMVEDFIEDNEGIHDILNYPEHLRAYINQHMISEFIELNPALQECSVKSTVIILKFDIQLTSKLAKVFDLKKAVAKILGLKPSELQLLDIRDGCVMVTFLISAVAAQTIFAHNKQFTPKEIEEFQALKVLCLEYDGNIYDFSTQVKIPGIKYKCDLYVLVHVLG